MVKVYGPALSLDASGTLGNALVFSKWKGRNYIRERVIPANPKSVLQVSMRAMFKWLTQEWKPNVTTADKAKWQTLADQLVASPFNAYVRFNQKRWRNQLTPSMIPVPVAGDGGGNINWNSTTGGVRMATLNFTVVAIQDGWGCLIARSQTTGFTPGVDSLVDIRNLYGGGDHNIIDTPLAAGTYYYRCLLFERWGTQMAAWMPEQPATVTA